MISEYSYFCDRCKQGFTIPSTYFSNTPNALSVLRQGHTYHRNETACSFVPADIMLLMYDDATKEDFFPDHNASLADDTPRNV